MVLEFFEEILSSELTVTKHCNRLLSEWIVQLERNAYNNAADEDLEVSMYKALFHWSWGQTRQSPSMDCFRLWLLTVIIETVIINFNCRKQKWRILIDRKLKFSGKLFISETLHHKSHQLAYKCELTLTLMK